MKPIKAWIVLDGDAVVVPSSAVPVFWHRQVARDEAREYLGDDGRVVRVEIREVLRPKRQR